MNTIVMNTMTGAVSEYSGFDFHAITPTHAGSALGLYALGGDRDIAAPIVATAMTGKTALSDMLQKYLGNVYFSIKAIGSATMLVQDGTATYRYPLEMTSTKEPRGVPGRGIVDRFLSFGFENTDGCAFSLDAIEVTVYNSMNRRS